MNIYKKYGIYSIRNTVNNKVYIGKTEMNFGDRWDSHKSLLKNNKHFNSYLQRAYNKYGVESFEFEIVRDCTGDSSDNINTLEIEFIKLYNSKSNGYNMSDGGDGARGAVRSAETKNKIGIKNRENMLGRKASEETRKKMSDSQKLRTHTKETINKMSESKKNKAVAEETKDKLRMKLKGVPKKTILNKEIVLKIRNLYSEGKTNRELSEIFGIKQQYMYGITSGRKWKNV